jgi:2-oxopent-4-enoate/cis-2-oxohex-4-enoate hydratase
MFDQQTTDRLADELYGALRSGVTIPLISKRHPDVTVDEAYRVSLSVLNRRLADGEKLIGKKIGLTSQAMQQMLGISEPDYGFLTDAMQVADGATVTIAQQMITPMIEAEIAFVMRAPLPLEGMTPEMVLEATEYVAASFELVDTRFDMPKLAIVDTVADNASSALFQLGQDRIDPRDLDLNAVICTLLRNGAVQSTGKGEAVMGSPLNSVAWLANRLGALGVQIEAGDVVLPGSLVPMVPVAPGDRLEAEFTGIGRVTCFFA